MNYKNLYYNLALAIQYMYDTDGLNYEKIANILELSDKLVKELYDNIDFIDN